MLLLNDTTQVFQVPVQDVVQSKGEDGKAREIPQPAKRTIQLVPGVNTVADEDMDRIGRLFLVKHHLREGTFKEIDGDARLSKRSAKEAVDLVRKTYDPGLLAKWREDDKRPQVQDAIGQQFKEITPTRAEDKK